MADWDRPLAEEILARALAVTGDGAAAREHWARAHELAAQVADPEEREVIDQQLAVEPDWPA
jgi:hypothetical protein